MDRVAPGLRDGRPPLGGAESRTDRDGAAAVRFVGFVWIGCAVTSGDPGRAPAGTDELEQRSLYLFFTFPRAFRDRTLSPARPPDRAVPSGGNVRLREVFVSLLGGLRGVPEADRGDGGAAGRPGAPSWS